jgi:hypothetical protein
MTLRSYLTIMIIMTMVCWSCWLYIMWTVNPEITNRLGFVLFYLSLFMSLAGSAALIGFLIRFVGLKQTLAFRSAKEAFRQSFLFSALVIASLILLSHGLFTWLNVALLVVGLSVLEFFLISYERNP